MLRLIVREVIMLTNKQMLLKTSTSLHYAMPVNNYSIKAKPEFKNPN